MLAFLAYLLSIPGALYVLAAHRRDAFAVFHARQSVALGLAALALPLIWAAIAWGLAWIPLLGPILGLILFALVLALYAGLGACWIAGMLFALRGRTRTVPVVGPLATRASVATESAVSQETAVDVI